MEDLRNLFQKSLTDKFFSTTSIDRILVVEDVITVESASFLIRKHFSIFFYWVFLDSWFYRFYFYLLTQNFNCSIGRFQGSSGNF